MKKFYSLFLMVALLAVCGANSTAQREEGTYFISPQITGLDIGNIQMKSDDADDWNKTTQTGIHLAGGQFIKDGIALRANLGYDKIGQEGMDMTIFMLGGGIRYFIPSMENFFGGAGLAWASAKQKPTGAKEDVIKAFMLTLEGGYSYHLTDNIAIEPALNYSFSLSAEAKSWDDWEEVYTTSDFNLKRFGLSVGITVYF